MNIEVAFKFIEPKNLAVIKFDSACRQLAKWPIMVANPLNKAVKFTCTSTVPDIFFMPGAELNVPASEQVFMDVCYRPVSETNGVQEGEVVLNCAELGSYPYKVEYQASAAALEKTIMFKAPLGTS